MGTQSPEQRVKAIFDEAVGSDLSSWEKFEFLPNIRCLDSLSPKQESVLRGIEIRIFGEGDDDERE